MAGMVELLDRDAPLFPISTAAQLAGMHPQTLRGYDRGLTWSLDHPRSVVAFSALVLVAMVPLWGLVPKGFLPTDDAGRIRVSTEGAEGTSFDAMVRLQRAAAVRHRAPSHRAEPDRGIARSVPSGRRRAEAPPRGDVRTRWADPRPTRRDRRRRSSRGRSRRA